MNVRSPQRRGWYAGKLASPSAEGVQTGGPAESLTESNSESRATEILFQTLKADFTEQKQQQRPSMFQNLPSCLGHGVLS